MLTAPEKVLPFQRLEAWKQGGDVQKKEYIYIPTDVADMTYRFVFIFLLDSEGALVEGCCYLKRLRRSAETVCILKCYILQARLFAKSFVSGMG